MTMMTKVAVAAAGTAVAALATRDAFRPAEGTNLAADTYSYKLGRKQQDLTFYRRASDAALGVAAAVTAGAALLHPTPRKLLPYAAATGIALLGRAVVGYQQHSFDKTHRRADLVVLYPPDMSRLDRNRDGTFAADDVSRTTPYGSLHYRPAYDELTRRVGGPVTQQSLDRFVSGYNRGVGRPADHDQAVADRDRFITATRRNYEGGSPGMAGPGGADLVWYGDLRLELLEHDSGMYHPSRVNRTNGERIMDPGIDRTNYVIERSIDPSALVTYDDAEVTILRQALGKHDLTRADLVAFYARYDSDRNGFITRAEEEPLQQLKRDLLDRKVAVEDLATRVPVRAQR